jgi:hypothetical protein
MSGPTAGDGAIELHLADGGRVIVAIEDEATRSSAECDDLIVTLLRVDGSEQDVERAIQAEAEDLGLHSVPSGRRHPTVITIERPAPRE